MVRRRVTVPISGEVTTTVDIQAEEKDHKIRPFEMFVFVSSIFLILLFFMKSLPSFENTLPNCLYIKNCTNSSCSECPNNQMGFDNYLLNTSNQTSPTIFKHLQFSGLNSSDSLNTCQASQFNRFRYGANILLVCWVGTLFLFALIYKRILVVAFTGLLFILLLFFVFFVVSSNPEVVTSTSGNGALECCAPLLIVIAIIAIALISFILVDGFKEDSLDKFLIASTSTQLVLIFIGVFIWVLNKVMPEKELFVSLMPCIPEGIGWQGMLCNPLNYLLPLFYLILFSIFWHCSDENSVYNSIQKSVKSVWLSLKEKCRKKQEKPPEPEKPAG
jgi:hypothetical protein